MTVKKHHVTGIGGIFFKARDPQALAAWYRRHLGIPVEDWGGATFPWRSSENPTGTGNTVWSPFKEDTTYFAPSRAPFMINYRVKDLDGFLAQLRREGCEVDANIEDSEFGKFGWVVDPEGNKIELWQPPEDQ
ncbi:MAG TPA: VOC family protein [Gammaproteobacteria bacterium]|nr:VOC family protein [Gammaproteobacteria bacterium]